MEDCKYATDCTPNYFNPQPTPPERLLSGSMRTDNTAKDTRRKQLSSHVSQPLPHCPWASVMLARLLQALGELPKIRCQGIVEAVVSIPRDCLPLGMTWWIR